jgi:small subunit ribosomal protein S3|tara:strand:+ start:1056 stop:1805 length:750 start_codon:yes stop_codon:yes gene_type:complete
MGNKVHPYGFRLGVIKEWQTRWFADRPQTYRENLLEDIKVRDFILKKHKDAAVSRVEIDRKTNEVRATIHSARPGVVIGRGGQRVEELRKDLEDITGKRIRVDINEIRQAELEAPLVAQSIAEQIERQVAFRRAIKQSVTRTMQSGAKGIKILVSGRLGGAEIARNEKAMAGRVPLHTIRADIDFGLAEAHTQMGKLGVKVWIYRGDVVATMSSAEENARRMALESNTTDAGSSGTESTPAVKAKGEEN